MKGLRDPSKSLQFFKQKEAGTIPEHILRMYDEAAKHPAGLIARRAEIVNLLFDGNTGGRGFTMNPDKPLFHETKTRYPEGYRANFE